MTVPIEPTKKKKTLLSQTARQKFEMNVENEAHCCGSFQPWSRFFCFGIVFLSGFDQRNYNWTRYYLWIAVTSAWLQVSLIKTTHALRNRETLHIKRYMDCWGNWGIEVRIQNSLVVKTTRETSKKAENMLSTLPSRTQLNSSLNLACAPDLSCELQWNPVDTTTFGLWKISKIQLVVYYQYCVLIGWATSRLFVIAH